MCALLRTAAGRHRDLNPSAQRHYNARAFRRVSVQLPLRILCVQAAGCAAASLLLGFFDFSLGLSVLLGGVVMLVPNAWFVRQIARRIEPEAATGERTKAEITEEKALALEPSQMARAHMVQAVVRLLATLILMGVVIAGYESLNPLGFFGCVVALALVHVLVSMTGRARDEQP